MLVLGLSGGFDPIDRNEHRFPWLPHDSAAVLLDGPTVVGAIEEERVNRIKHTTCFPEGAIRSCLAQAGASIGDVGAIGYYFTQPIVDSFLALDRIAKRREDPFVPARARLSACFERAFSFDVGDRLHFVNHHRAHAASAFVPSGFDEALVMVVDGMGDAVSFTVMRASRERTKRAPARRVSSLPDFEVLDTFTPNDSLGMFYLRVTEHLGYQMFDEYKIMGLAPYGDPGRFRQALQGLYALHEHGRYAVHHEGASELLSTLLPRRSRGEPFGQIHKDLAAAAQDALETIMLHVAAHWQRTTGLRNVCLAGGVAHNCSFNGRLLYSNLFERVFVQPASHDAGCALGAAYCVSMEGKPEPELRSPGPLDHVFWGRDIGTEPELERTLGAWKRMITFSRPADLDDLVASRLASGEVAGWVQGRSEFGPRALGNRSILADPRPAANRDIVNFMVKKREGYRPFAPVVRLEDVGRFYEVPETAASLDFMTYVLRTRSDKREPLGAVTHVDGSARVQTVSRQSNERLWRLLGAFQERTTFPILLNTSFNNNVEPIVDTVDDAVACFLTTGLHFLVVGPYLIERRPDWREGLTASAIRLPGFVRLQRDDTACTIRNLFGKFGVEFSGFSETSRTISPETFSLLEQADATPSVGGWLRAHGDVASEAVLSEVYDLWGERLIRLLPAPNGR